MWSETLIDAILQKRYSNDWPAKFKVGFNQLFGSDTGRYPEVAKGVVTLRAPAPSSVILSPVVALA